MKINVYVRIIAAILAALWMMRIFSYSSDDAPTSTAVSRSVSFDIVRSVNDIFKFGWDEDRIDGVSRKIEKTVRKLAHMTEYAILGALVGTACDAWRYVRKAASGVSAIRGIIAFGICLVYAVSDEFHQTFVDGRSGEISDVIIDMTGAILAMAVIALVIAYIAGRRKDIDESVFC